MFTMRKKSIDFTSGRLMPLIVAYAIPIILSGLVQAMFNAADMAVLGAFDESSDSSAVGAVGATGSIAALLVNSFIGFSGGTNVLLARAVGAKDDERSQKIVGSSLLLAVFAGAFVLIVGFLSAPWFLTVTDCPSNSSDGALTYLRIYLSAAPVILIYNFASAIIRVSGDSRSPFTYILIAGGTNVILNYLLCFILPNKVAAVAIATLASNVIGAVLTVVHLFKLKEGPCRVDIRNLHFSARETVNILLLGLPNAFTSALYSISNLQIQSAINSFGSSASAGNNASVQLENFVSTVYSSFASTCMVSVGQNLGARKRERVKGTIIRCVITTFSITVFLGISMLVFGRPLLGLFVPNDEVALSIGTVRLTVCMALFWALAVDSTLSFAIRAFGNTFLPMLNSVFSIILFRTVWMNLIYPHMTFVGDPVKDIFNVYECYIFSWLLSLALQILFFALTYRKYSRGKLREI